MDKDEEVVKTITKADMIAHLVARGFGRVMARQFVDAFFDEIKSVLILGEDVKLSGLGHFMLRDKRKRPGRNPKTQKSVPISARRVVTFRAGPTLKKQVGQSSSKDQDEHSGRSAAW